MVFKDCSIEFAESVIAHEIVPLVGHRTEKVISPDFFAQTADRQVELSSENEERGVLVSLPI
jgi:pseudouridine-5'-phosphate glycosidase